MAWSTSWPVAEFLDLQSRMHREMRVVDDCLLGITPSEVERGELSRLFQGAPAVILRQDDRVDELLETVLSWLRLNRPRTTDSFGSNLVDLARNHEKGNMSAGDMLRFVPRMFGHVSRKFVIYPSGVDQSLKAYPEAFYVGHQRIPVPDEIMTLAWSLMEGIFASASPASADRLKYATEVDVLTYPTSNLDVGRLSTLLMDSTLLADSIGVAGFWSKLGHRIDEMKDSAAGLFQMKALRDVYAISSLIPGLNKIVTALNGCMSSSDDGNSVPDGYHLIGAPHVDTGKYLTALGGCRENLCTEVLWDNRWIELPVRRDALALFPSGKLAPISGFTPTRHRVLLHDPSGNGSICGRNITLSLSIVDPPNVCAQESAAL